MEIDCTGGDIDVWGNGNDLFYIYCPYNENVTTYRFIEGYFQESPNSPLGVELYNYNIVTGGSVGSDDYGRFTDKNGFYFSYTKNAHAGISDIHITGNINCTLVDFDIGPFAIKVPMKAVVTYRAILLAL